MLYTGLWQRADRRVSEFRLSPHGSVRPPFPSFVAAASCAILDTW